MYRVLRLKNDTEINGAHFVKGTEFEVLKDVVYMAGLPVAINAQKMLLDWINDNPTLFVNDKRG